MRLDPLACLVSIILVTHASTSAAQGNGLPEPPRSVYKCEADGKVSYSQEPCLGAKRVDLQPTRGLNKSSGREQVGTDVARERQYETIAEGVRPVTGLSPEELKKAGQRARLDPKIQRECRDLDAHIARAEAQEKNASSADLASLQKALYTMRTRHRTLGC